MQRWIHFRGLLSVWLGVISNQQSQLSQSASIKHERSRRNPACTHTHTLCHTLIRYAERKERYMSICKYFPLDTSKEMLTPLKTNTHTYRVTFKCLTHFYIAVLLFSPLNSLSVTATAAAVTVSSSQCVWEGHKSWLSENPKSAALQFWHFLPSQMGPVGACRAWFQHRDFRWMRAVPPATEVPVDF